MTGTTPPPAGAPRRRRPVTAVLVVVFVVAPLLELYVLIQVGQVIGGWSVVGLVLLSAVLGGWLVRREGARAWTALLEALQSGRMPAREIADAGLVLLGGTLMIAPGLVTDVLGLVLALPITRPAARRVLTGLVARRLWVGPVGPTGPGARNHRRTTTDPAPGPGSSVVEGEVVDDDPTRDGARPDDGRG